MHRSRHLPVAIHILLCVDAFQGKKPVTSRVLAASTGVHPVDIRRLMSQLAKAGLLTGGQGRLGNHLNRPLARISLYDVYQAVEPEPEKPLFPVHTRSSQECPVGRHIQQALQEPFYHVEQAIKTSMEELTLDRIQKEIGLLERANPSFFPLTTDF